MMRKSQDVGQPNRSPWMSFLLFALGLFTCIVYLEIRATRSDYWRLRDHLMVDEFGDFRAKISEKRLAELGFEKQGTYTELKTYMSPEDIVIGFSFDATPIVMEAPKENRLMLFYLFDGSWQGL